jgi:hypothetical protein
MGALPCLPDWTCQTVSISLLPLLVNHSKTAHSETATDLMGTKTRTIMTTDHHLLVSIALVFPVMIRVHTALTMVEKLPHASSRLLHLPTLS